MEKQLLNQLKYSWDLEKRLPRQYIFFTRESDARIPQPRPSHFSFRQLLLGGEGAPYTSFVRSVETDDSQTSHRCRADSTENEKQQASPRPGFRYGKLT